MNSSLLPLHEVTLYLLQTTWPKVNDWQIKIRAAVFRYDAFCYIIRQYHQYPDVTLLTKIRLVKAMVFPVVTYGCENWTIKKAECQNWCFWTVVLGKTLESSLNCKEIKPVHSKGNQSWIHWKDWCWSWSSNTLATWCKELTHLKRPWWWERLKAREEGDNRG